MKRIDGTAIAQKVHEETRERVDALKALGLRPGLAVVLVGDDPASRNELLGDDDEVAAVIGHELSHVVQRDHYNVIKKQETQTALTDAASSNVAVGGGVAGSMAKDYVRRHGATILATRLDREAEFRADEAAEIYLARAGYDPLALYAVLQKMTARGSTSGNLAQLYKTHPPLDARLDRLDRNSVASAGR